MANIKLVLILLALAIGMAGAEPTKHHVIIRGYITEIGSGEPVEDAEVTGICLNNSNSFSTESNDKGKYLHVIDCQIGGTVQITATKGNSTGTNSTVVLRSKDIADGEAVLDAQVNNQEIVNVQIPEFPTAAAPVLLSMLSFGLLRYKRK